jgi:signal transduction histidine kinase/CheY-like chemotaxis protein
LSADLLINKPLGLSPKKIEFKRGHLYDINPVGAVSMGVATAVGLSAYLGVFGEELKTLGHFLSIATCFVCVPFMAWLTKGKYYLARESEVIVTSKNTRYETCECGICQNEFETEDVLYCPAYQQTICSLCCSLDARCLDQCKSTVFELSTWLSRVRKIIPVSIASPLFGRPGQFIAWFTLVNAFVGALMALVYRHMVLQGAENLDVFASGLWTLFFTLMMVSGVITWLFLLSHESRVVAQQESNRQTRKLVEEIEAHNQTDSQLQQAKDLAERANAAKSRYLSGISHELRTPLQSILGYTQLLSDRSDTPNTHQSGLKTIHRSGQYLADLIEGLLDVSKIEAGRLDLHISQFAFPDLIQQLSHMFQMQAETKGIELKLHIHSQLPNWVSADEKRLRQVLINLLSNAIKYTEQGSVEFHVSYRSQVAEFEVIDTGAGIPESEHDRIFSPFERVKNDETPNVPGTGLGLTIVKLLVEIMGGDIQMTSKPGEGSRFKVMLMLPWVQKEAKEIEREQTIVGYDGPPKTIAIVDDDAVVRGMLKELLSPLGFSIIEAASAEQCLTNVSLQAPDLFILDVNMSGKTGLELAKELRSLNVKAPIVMLSANAQIPDLEEQAIIGFNEYLVKPVDNQRLLFHIKQLLDLTWKLQEVVDEVNQISFQDESQRKISIKDSPIVNELLTAIDIGYKRGVVSALRKLHEAELLPTNDFEYLLEKTERMQFAHVTKIIEVN